VTASDVAGATPSAVDLRRTATGIVLEVDAPSLSFGDVAVGASAPLGLTVTNVGNVDAAVAWTSPDPAFVPSSPVVVRAGAGLPVVVTFQPAASGPSSATLSFGDPPVGVAYCVSPPAVIVSGAGVP
jgi:hypothetical protein